MKLSQINFCNVLVTQVIDHETKHAILHQIKSLTNFDINTKCYKWFHVEDLNHMHKVNAISMLTKGLAYWLYLTIFENQPYCLLISKKIKPGYPYPKILLVHYQFHPDMFRNTLFEVELIKHRDRDTWMLLLNDLILYQEVFLYNNQHTLEYRFNKMYDILSNHYRQELIVELCSLQIRKIYPPNKVEELFEFCKQLPYDVYGFLLYGIHKSNFIKTQWDDKLNEMRQRQTVNIPFLKELSRSIGKDMVFYVKRTLKPDVYHLYIKETADKIVFYDVAYIPNIQFSKLLKSHFTDKDEHFMVKCKCRFYPHFDKWGVSEMDVQDDVIRLNDFSV